MTRRLLRTIDPLRCSPIGWWRIAAAARRTKKKASRSAPPTIIESAWSLWRRLIISDRPSRPPARGSKRWVGASKRLALRGGSRDLLALRSGLRARFRGLTLAQEFYRCAFAD